MDQPAAVHGQFRRHWRPKEWFLADMNSCPRSARQLSWPTRPVPCAQEVGHIIGTTRDAVRQRRWKLRW